MTRYSILCPFLPAGRQGPRPHRAGLTGHAPVTTRHRDLQVPFRVLNIPQSPKSMKEITSLSSHSKNLVYCIISERVILCIKLIFSEEIDGSLENLCGHHSGRRHRTRAQLLDPRYRQRLSPHVQPLCHNPPRCGRGVDLGLRLRSINWKWEL